MYLFVDTSVHNSIIGLLTSDVAVNIKSHSNLVDKT
jgi:hypothetical protein